MTVENIIGMLALTCTNFYFFLQTVMYKTDNPGVYGMAVLLVVSSAVGTQVLKAARPMTLEKRFEFYSWKKCQGRID